AVQGDQIRGCSEAQSRLAVEALAGLHGSSWCDQRWLELSEVAMPKPGDAAAAQMMGDVARSGVDIVLDRLGGQLDPADHHALRAAIDVVVLWLADQPRFALMHGDFRADNVLFKPDTDAVTIVDWQTIGVGLPARDLAYFTASSLESDVRRAIEVGLVDHYY